MYERFTDRSRKVMQLANQEAQRHNHDCVETAHVLVALVREESGVAGHALAGAGVNLADARSRLLELIHPGAFMVTMGRLPLSDGLKESVAAAIGESKELGHDYVGTEHLLLGLLRNRANCACIILGRLGVQGDALRDAVVKLTKPPCETDASRAAAEQNSAWEGWLIEEIKRLASRLSTENRFKLLSALMPVAWQQPINPSAEFETGSRGAT